MRSHETQKIGDIPCEVCGKDCTLLRPMQGKWDEVKKQFVWRCNECLGKENNEQGIIGRGEGAVGREH